mmetsp:Transcript_27132/g.33524  ORF Transcript_27132/g.33524 Transcript_27132/m.33524 type:complete len:148 (+) Transcript_27132:448-891(+)
MDDLTDANEGVNSGSPQHQSSLTTEERLERYYDSRGINKTKENQYANDIEIAIASAQKANSPESAILALKKMQPYLQANTRLGGMALLELTIALWQRDGQPDDDLLEKLVGNAHVKGQVQQLIKRGKPPSRDNSFWQGICNPNQWWD